MNYDTDPYRVDHPCRYCDQEMVHPEDIWAGAHKSCIEDDQEEVDAIWETCRHE